MRRRDAMSLLAAGVLPARLARAGQQAHTLRKNPASYRRQFFSESEHSLIDAVAEMIIPADSYSPGARAARVADFIDLIVANSAQAAQARWREQIAAFTALSSLPFIDLPEAGKARILDLAAGEEQSPRTDAGRFFAAMKQMTVFAYYSSEPGIRKELGYLGNQALSGFPGCRA